MNTDALEQFLPIFGAIPTEHVKSPHIYIGTFLSTASQLVPVVAQDIDKLTKTGLREDVLRNYPTAVEALRVAEVFLNKSRFVTEEAHTEWEQKAPVVYDYLEEMECAYRLAYRRLPQIKALVQQILESRSSQGGINELLSLVELGESNIQQLIAIGFDITKLQKATYLAKDLQNIYLNSVKHDAKTEAARDMRDRAYTYLEAFVGDIRAAGRFLFWDQPEMYGRYTRVYHKSSTQRSIDAIHPTPRSKTKSMPLNPLRQKDVEKTNLGSILGNRDRAKGTSKPMPTPPSGSTPLRGNRFARGHEDDGAIEQSKF